MPYWTNYAASKAYNLHFSNGLWYELKEKGIDVLALCPGATQTEFSKVAGTKNGGMESAAVVKLALNNLGKKSTVVAGFSNQFITFLMKFIPRQTLIRVGAKVISGMVQKL